MIRATSTLGCAVCLLAASARAERTVGVVTAGTDPQTERQALVGYRVWAEQLLPRHKEWVDLAAQARADDERDRKQKTAQAAELVTGASEAIDGLDLAGAVDKLDRAVALLADADLAQDMSALTHALALRAVALHLSGGDSRSRADDAAAQLFAASPDYRFPGGRFSPEVQAWLEAGRSAAKQLAPVSVDLQTSAPALVWVDGLYRGTAPQQISGLIPGAHHVSLLATGSKLTQSGFVAEAGHAALQPELEFPPAGKQLVGLLDALKSGAAAGTLAAPGRALCTAVGTDEVLLLEFRQEGGATKLEAIRVGKDGGFARQTIAVAGAGEEALEAAENTALASLSAPLQSGPSGGGVAGQGEEPLLTTRTWSYVALGGSAALLVSGIALGASAQSQVNQAKANLIDQPTAYAAAVKNAQSAAVGADVCYVAAAVAAGVGGWLFYSSLSTPSSPAAPAAPAKPADDEHLGASLVPLSGGAAVSISGRF